MLNPCARESKAGEPRVVLERKLISEYGSGVGFTAQQVLHHGPQYNSFPFSV